MDFGRNPPGQGGLQARGDYGWHEVRSNSDDGRAKCHYKKTNKSKMILMVRLPSPNRYRIFCCNETQAQIPPSPCCPLDQVTQLIQERILDGIYAAGERLNIDALSRELNVSSSPIREALTRLSALGLVVSSPFLVSPVPTREWFEQLRDFRILAESEAARQLARRQTRDAIEKMTNSLHLLERAKLGRRAREYIAGNKADKSFHGALLDGSGNEILANSIRSLHPHLHHARLFSKVPQDIAPVIEGIV